MSKITLKNGDCLDELKKLENNSIDSVVTDPPYGISFMGKKWDYDVPSVEVWQEVMRVLKPGGHALVACGTRTQHRMAVNLEDAGFEIRDMIAWVYGSGFPKSHNIGKAVDKLMGNEREVLGIDENKLARANKNTHNSINVDYRGGWDRKNNYATITKGTSEWEGWGTALKPSIELFTLCRKPLSEKTVADNVLKWGTGGINIDESRVPTSYTDAYTGDGSSESIVPLHKLSELRHKAHILVSSFFADKKDYQIPSSDGQCVPTWLKLQDYLGDCLICRGLYDELSPLFQEDDQVSFRRLHDVHDGIVRLRKAQSDNLSGLDTDHLSNLDDFVSLILSYSNYTTPDIKNARFPANLIHDGSEEVVSGFPESKSCKGKNVQRKDCPNTAMSGRNYARFNKEEGYDDSGSASRFFYCAKASKKDRNEGLEGFEEKTKVFNGQSSEPSQDMKGVEQKFTTQPQKNNHPTVKPTKLMQYLVRLVTRKGGVVLDPFMGSGSTGKACKLEGMDFIGIELDPEYVKIAEARINAYEKQA